MLMLRHHPQGPPGTPLGDPHHLAGPPVDLSGHYAAFAGQPPFTHSWQLECLYMMGANTENIQHRGWENCILEMRKEKSRDAARSRRGKENYEFYELAKLLPLPAAITTQLDKASIIRLSISYLKLRDFTQHGDPPWHRDLPSSNKSTLKGGSMRSSSRSGGSTVAMDIFEQHQGTHILQSLDGFAFALSADGRFLYISETVSIYLGLSQVEMTGSSVFDYIHQQDHAELAEQLGINLSSASSTSSSPGSAASSDDGSSSSVPGGTSTPTGLDRPLPVMQLNSQTAYKGTDRSFCIRMKSTLTKRGCHFKSSGYRVVLVLSHLRPQYTFSSQHRGSSKPHGAQGGGGGVNVMGMVAMAIALPPPSINEVRLESDMFVTRLTFEFRVAHCEPRVSDLLDYTAEDLTGKNMYALCHGQDVQRLRKCHIDLINKGQVMSSYYRLLNKGAGFTWLQTCATVICNSKNSDEQSIICVNYVLSAAEYENCILDCSQMPNSGNLKPDDPSNSERGCSASSPDAASDPRGGGGGDEGSSSRDGCCTPQPDGGRTTTSGDAEHLRMVAGERCSIRGGESSNGFDMDHPKQLDMDPMARYHPPPLPKHHDGHRHNKKRRLDPSSHRKSPPSGNPTGGGSSSPQRATTPTALCSSPTSSPSDEKIDRPWKRCSPSRTTAYGSSSSGSSAMSVKDLEDVMNKHLPSEDKGQQRSTIQWIGGAPPQPPTLPASSLLRQIYVNRESVIRSGAHISGRPTWEGGAPQGAPTSPEQYEGQFGVISGGYSAYMDSYSAAMTPPASVSPRDKYPPPQHPGISDTAAFSEAAAAAAAAAIPHMHHHYDHLPLKPQVFVHPGAASSLDYAGHDQQQQVYHASGFHLYHKTPTSHHSSSSSWYPQPNT